MTEEFFLCVLTVQLIWLESNLFHDFIFLGHLKNSSKNEKWKKSYFDFQSMLTSRLTATDKIVFFVCVYFSADLTQFHWTDQLISNSWLTQFWNQILTWQFFGQSLKCLSFNINSWNTDNLNREFTHRFWLRSL